MISVYALIVIHAFVLFCMVMSCSTFAHEWAWEQSARSGSSLTHLMSDWNRLLPPNYKNSLSLSTAILLFFVNSGQHKINLKLKKISFSKEKTIFTVYIMVGLPNKQQKTSVWARKLSQFKMTSTSFYRCLFGLNILKLKVHMLLIITIWLVNFFHISENRNNLPTVLLTIWILTWWYDECMVLQLNKHLTLFVHGLPL